MPISGFDGCRAAKVATFVRGCAAAAIAFALDSAVPRDLWPPAVRKNRLLRSSRALAFWWFIMRQYASFEYRLQDRYRRDWNFIC